MNYSPIFAHTDDCDPPDNCAGCGRYETRCECALLALLDTPIAREVERHQDRGASVYLFGFTHDGRYALVVDPDGRNVCVAAVATVNGIGRWECSTAHLRDHMDLYVERFPIRP